MLLSNLTKLHIDDGKNTNGDESEIDIIDTSGDESQNMDGESQVVTIDTRKNIDSQIERWRKYNDHVEEEFVTDLTLCVTGFKTLNDALNTFKSYTVVKDHVCFDGENKIFQITEDGNKKCPEYRCGKEHKVSQTAEILGTNGKNGYLCKFVSLKNGHVGTLIENYVLKIDKTLYGVPPNNYSVGVCAMVLTFFNLQVILNAVYERLKEADIVDCFLPKPELVPALLYSTRSTDNTFVYIQKLEYYHPQSWCTISELVRNNGVKEKHLHGINRLLKVISILNKIKVYHNDLHSENILIEKNPPTIDTVAKIRIIDVTLMTCNRYRSEEVAENINKYSENNLQFWEKLYKTELGKFDKNQ
jgi:hypothetical protein